MSVKEHEPERARIQWSDRAKSKVEEGYGYLRDLEVKDFGPTVEFRPVISSILAAARSAHDILERKLNTGFATWKATLRDEGLNTLAIGQLGRNLETHNEGAEMATNQEFTWVPTPGNYRHSFRVPINGKTEIIPVAGLARRYLGLMKDAAEKVT
jgi:hypothetical protein